MKKIQLVNETLNEFAKRGRPRKIKSAPEDNWYAGEDEFDAPAVGPEQIEDVEIEDEVTDLAVQKQIKKRLENELASPEFNRVAVKFRTATGENMGIPMAKLSGGDAFLMKTKSGGMKKVKVSDMMVESAGTKQFVSESFKSYE